MKMNELDELNMYRMITENLFAYMNGKVNTLNSQCNLEIGYWDVVNGTFGNIRYPNSIIINIGTIINSWRQEWSSIMAKKEYVGTCIAWAIAHELHHADQQIAMLRYNNEPAYKSRVECDVEVASYNWVKDHASEISSIGGFTVRILDLESPNIKKSDRYRKASVKEFYLQTIENVLLRDSNLFNSFKIFTDDDFATDIVLRFSQNDVVTIKSNSRYLSENVNLFSNLVYNYAGMYNSYKIILNGCIKQMPGHRRIAIMDIGISDYRIIPMSFGK